MSELVLKYSDLGSMANYARKTASDCDSYVDELNRKLTNKWSSVPPSPMNDGNGRIDSASYYVKQKIIKLNTKSIAFRTFASKAETFQENAKSADSRVAKTVNGSRESFLKAHENLRPHGFLAAIMNIPGLGWLADGISKIKEVWTDLKGNIRYWYECCGGKKILDTALAITGFVLAAVGAIVAVITIGPFTSVFAAVVAIAGVVAAVIGVVNAGFNLYNQLRANGEEDPAWAQYYGNIDSFSDTLRQTTFKSGFWNRFSSGFADAWDITDMVCSVISIGDSLHSMYKRSGLNKLFSSKTTTVVNGTTKKVYKFDFAKFKSTVSSKDGWAKIGKTLKTNWKGTLFGDGGGIKNWQKRFKRTFTSQNTSGLGRTKKIFKMFKSDFGKVDKTLKILNTVIKSSFGGFKGKDSYSIIKGAYSIGGYGGAVSAGTSTYDAIIDIRDKIRGRQDHLKKMAPGGS